MKRKQKMAVRASILRRRSQCSQDRALGSSLSTLSEITTPRATGIAVIEGTLCAVCRGTDLSIPPPPLPPAPIQILHFDGRHAHVHA